VHIKENLEYWGTTREKKFCMNNTLINLLFDHEFCLTMRMSSNTM